MDLSKLKPIKQRGNVQRIRFKVTTPVDRRFVENEYWKYYIRRALYQIGAPLDKRSIQFASDTIPFRNHISGVDYIDARFFEQVDQAELLTQLKDPVKDLLPHWQILGAKSYTAGMVQVRSIPSLNHYLMPFDAEDEGLVASRLQKVLEGDEFKVTLRTEGYMGVDREEINAREYVHTLWAHREGTSLMVNMVLKNRLSPYDMYGGLFPQAMSRIYAIPALRIDSYLEVDAGQEDFFRPTCVECGTPIEISLFDEPVHEDYCLFCQHSMEGVLIRAH